MKHYTKIALFCLVIIVAAGCKKEEVFTKFPAPTWTVDNSTYSVSMTAVVKLPTELEPFAQADDQLAAMAGDVCRGVGVKINGLWYVSIQGESDDDSNIRFSYYSARNQYLYNTDNLFTFEPDAIYGTVDNPKVLKLNVVK
jgi:hypothetical protein